MYVFNTGSFSNGQTSMGLILPGGPMMFGLVTSTTGDVVIATVELETPAGAWVPTDLTFTGPGVKAVHWPAGTAARFSFSTSLNVDEAFALTVRNQK